MEHDRRSQCGVTPTGTRDSGGGQDRVAHRSSALPRVGAISGWCQVTSTSPGTSTGTTSSSTGSTSISVGTTSNSSSSTLPSGYVRPRGPPRSLVRSKRFSETTQQDRESTSKSEVDKGFYGQHEADMFLCRTRAAKIFKGFSKHRLVFLVIGNETVCVGSSSSNECKMIDEAERMSQAATQGR